MSTFDLGLIWLDNSIFNQIKQALMRVRATHEYNLIQYPDMLQLIN